MEGMAEELVEPSSEKLELEYIIRTHGTLRAGSESLNPSAHQRSGGCGMKELGVTEGECAGGLHT